MRYAIQCVPCDDPNRPVGSLHTIVSDNAKLPAGCHWCYGQIVSKNSYPELWNVIGDLHTPLGYFPPDGMFCLPDMREAPRYLRRHDHKDHRNAEALRRFPEFDHLKQMLDEFSLDLFGPLGNSFTVILMALKILELQDRIEQLELARAVR